MRTGHPVVKETIRGLGRVLPDPHQVKGGLGLSHKLGVSPVVALSSKQASRNSFVSCPFSPDCDSASLRPSPCSPLSLLARSTFFVVKCRLRRRMINDSPHIITKCKQTALITTSEESAMQNILHPMSYSLQKAGVNILAAYLHQDVPYFK